MPCSGAVCGVRGFSNNPRELYDIPEVRAFCRRLVTLGFISYLDFSTVFHPDLPSLAKSGWGAAEVWLCGASGRRVLLGAINVRTGTPLLLARERQRAGPLGVGDPSPM